MAYCVDTTRGTAVISDAFFKFRNIEQNHPLGIGESLAECQRTYDRVRKEAQVILPLYEPGILQRFPEGFIE
jgi:hypothetical protein